QQESALQFLLIHFDKPYYLLFVFATLGALTSSTTTSSVVSGSLTSSTSFGTSGTFTSAVRFLAFASPTLVTNPRVSTTNLASSSVTSTSLFAGRKISSPLRVSVTSSTCVFFKIIILFIILN